MLTTDDLAGRHRYLARNRPDWTGSMASIRNVGGPWACPNGHASLLVYRCSICGKDLASNSSTQGQR